MNHEHKTPASVDNSVMLRLTLICHRFTQLLLKTTVQRLRVQQVQYQSIREALIIIIRHLQKN